MAHKFPQDLLTLITHLKKLPGVGTRTAERFAFEFLTWDAEALAHLSRTLEAIKDNIPSCPICGCLTQRGDCAFCHHRDTTSLCLLASPRDAYALEETGSYKGLYHIIPHLLSPLDGRHTLSLDAIERRLSQNPISELIIAFDSTLEGDTTALYLKKSLARPHLSISRLAFGLPIGTSLEHIDSGTLTRALTGRQLV